MKCLVCGSTFKVSEVKNKFPVLTYDMDHTKKVDGKVVSSHIVDKCICDTCLKSTKIKIDEPTKCEICGENTIYNLSNYYSDEVFETTWLARKLGKPICLYCADEIMDIGPNRNRKSYHHKLGEVDLKDNTYDKCLHHLTYGVEIETSEVVCQTKADTWERKGDATIRGLEFNSPVLQGDKGFVEIESFLNGLEASVDANCGLHVHIAPPSADTMTAVKIFNMYLSIHPYIYQLVEPHRVGHSYCSKWDSGVVAWGYQENVKNISRLGRDWINFNPLVNKSKGESARTVEVRLYQGTLNYDEITNWINLHGCLIEWASKAPPSEIKETMDKIKNVDDFMTFIANKVSVKVLLFYYEWAYREKNIVIVPRKYVQIDAGKTTVEKIKKEIDRLAVKNRPELDIKLEPCVIIGRLNATTGTIEY